MEIKSYMKYKNKDCIFYIKKSSVCDSLGLFAKKDIKENTYITYYYGYISRVFKISKKNKYIMEYSSIRKKIKDSVLVGVKNINRLNLKGAAQIANDAICWEITKKENNSIFIQEGKFIFIKSKKNIKKGEEILVSYGIKYWNNQITRFSSEYNDKFKIILKIINKLINVIEKYIKTEIYEYIGLYKNLIKLDLIENKRWCIYSNLWHQDVNFNLYMYKNTDNIKVNIYYECLTCYSKQIFLESISNIIEFP